MVNASAIKKKLQTKIFNSLGSDVSIKSLDSSTTNIYGEVTPTYGTPVVITAVPYSQISNKAWESFGDVSEGEIDIILPDGTDIDYNSRVSFDGYNHKVVSIEKYPLQDVNLAILVRIARIQ